MGDHGLAVIDTSAALPSWYTESAQPMPAQQQAAQRGHPQRQPNQRAPQQGRAQQHAQHGQVQGQGGGAGDQGGSGLLEAGTSPAQSLQDEELVHAALRRGEAPGAQELRQGGSRLRQQSGQEHGQPPNWERAGGPGAPSGEQQREQSTHGGDDTGGGGSSGAGAGGDDAGSDDGGGAAAARSGTSSLELLAGFVLAIGPRAAGGGWGSGGPGGVSMEEGPVASTLPPVPMEVAESPPVEGRAAAGEPDLPHGSLAAWMAHARPTEVRVCASNCCLGSG